MNFCPQCGASLKDGQDNCPNCNQVIKEIKLEPSQTAENITKSPVFDYTKIINLINFMQHNFYLNFIVTMLLFIVFSFLPQLGWLLLILSLIVTYWFANYRTDQSLDLNQKIESWFVHQVMLVPEKLDELDGYTQQFSEETRQFYHSVKNKAQTQVENLKETYQQSPFGVNQTKESLTMTNQVVDEQDKLLTIQMANDTGSLRRRRRLQSRARTTQRIKNKEVESSEVSHRSLTSTAGKASPLYFVIYLVLVAFSLFIYYRGINEYSLFDFNASVLWNSYQQTTFTMSEVIEALGYGTLFDSSGQSEFLETIFTIVAYYLPVVFAILSFLPSKISGFVQFMISITMGGSMLYLIYAAMDSNLFIRYGNEYGSFSTDLGLGSQMILGSIILLMVCSVFKLFKGK